MSQRRGSQRHDDAAEEPKCPFLFLHFFFLFLLLFEAEAGSVQTARCMPAIPVTVAVEACCQPSGSSSPSRFACRFYSTFFASSFLFSFIFSSTDFRERTATVEASTASPPAPASDGMARLGSTPETRAAASSLQRGLRQETRQLHLKVESSVPVGRCASRAPPPPASRASPPPFLRRARAAVECCCEGTAIDCCSCRHRERSCRLRRLAVAPVTRSAMGCPLTLHHSSTQKINLFESNAVVVVWWLRWLWWLWCGRGVTRVCLSTRAHGCN